MKSIFAFVLPVLVFIMIPRAYGQSVDSLRHPKDSAMPMPPDPTTDFFQQGEKSKSPGKIIVVTRAKKTLTLSNFLKSLSAGGSSSIFTDHVFSDLDNDGRKELVVSNYTGGAHCCDELYIFKNTATNRYQHVTRLFAGHTMITLEKKFIYSFYEPFGYFFTCYACAYTDTSDAGPVETNNIEIQYVKGKMVTTPGGQELRSTIHDNLGKLSELPYEKLEDDAAQDSGVRKLFALNLAVFYYSFGRNFATTQQLFNKYYKFPDAKKVWAAFSKQLLAVRQQNDF